MCVSSLNDILYVCCACENAWFAYFLGVSPSGGEIRKCQIERKDESMDLSEYDRIVRIEYNFDEIEEWVNNGKKMEPVGNRRRLQRTVRMRDDDAVEFFSVESQENHSKKKYIFLQVSQKITQNEITRNSLKQNNTGMFRYERSGNSVLERE